MLFIWIALIQTYVVKAQCPDILTSTISPACNNCTICPNTSFTFNVTGTNLPNGGYINWYAGTTPGFNPYLPEGTMIGQSLITTPPPVPCVPCPEILAIFVDVCIGGSDAADEFILLSSGGGFNTNNLQIDYAVTNNGPIVTNNDINIGPSPCGLQIPTSTLVNNIQNDLSCAGLNVFFAGPNTQIPAGVVVILFTSASEIFDYDFSALCSTGQTIYILQSSCPRTIGAFSNNSANGDRTTVVTLSNCPACNSSLTYDTDSPLLTGDGAFVYENAAGATQYANNGCVAPPVTSVPIPPPTSTVAPFTYLFDNSYCSDTWGGPVYIVGIISPAPMSPCTEEFTNYFQFTMACPDAVASNNGPICVGEMLQLFADPVPGAMYSWSGPLGYSSMQQNPVVSNNATAGMAGTYTLTTTISPCSDMATTTVVVNPKPTATLTGPNTVCEGEMITLNVAFTGTGPWTFNYNIGGVAQPPITTSTNPYQLILSPTASTVVVLTGVSNAICPGTFSGSISIAFHTTPVISNIVVVCLTGTTYQVTFTVSNGGLPYTNSGPTGGSFSGSNFTSVPIPLNTPYTFNIDDINGCGPITLSGILTTCPCVGDAGTMDQTLINACDSTVVTAMFNNDHVLGPGQVLRFILHTNPGAPPGTILATSSTPTFNLATIPGIIPGVTYYISSVVGALVAGNIDYSDPCTRISTGQPIIVHEVPNVTFSWDWTLCLNQCEDVVLTFTGEPNFTLNVGVNIPPLPTFNGQVVSPNLSGAFTICAPPIDLGDATFYAYSISNAFCSRTLNYQHSIVINAPSTRTINPTLCAGGSIVVNGTTYNQANPSGTEVTTNAVGCDSTITVNLSFYPAIVTNLTQTLCFGQFITVNGNVYNQANPMGQEHMTAGNGCDSTINVNLSFSNSSMTTINPTLCPGGTVVVNGVTYGQSNPNAVVTLVGQSGCDSIITVSLTFYPNAVGNVNPTLCAGGNIVVNGTTYNQSNPSGVEILTSSHGCDSTVNVNLSFYPANIVIINPTLCSGDFLVVNGVTYNQSNPTGTQTLIGANGCDSTINVNLSFYPPATAIYTTSICLGDTIFYNGTAYHQTHPSGIEVLVSSQGCDSIVNVNISFFAPTGSQINQTLCFGQQIIVNGTIYNETNPIGSEVLPSANGCDSTIIINLSFSNAAVTNIEPILCPSDSILINGTYYGANLPSGTDTLAGASGCDSILLIQVSFYSIDTNFIQQDICSGGSLIVNGITYDEQNPSGLQYINTPAGCDSVISVALNIVPALVTMISPTICHEDTIVINGLSYFFGNDNSVDTLQSSLGCDSIVVIAVNYYNQASSNVNLSACTGQSVIYNGQTYDATNTTGIDTFSTSTGCDSLVFVTLTLSDTIKTAINLKVCANENVPIGSEVFNMANPSGSVLFVSSAGCDSLVSVSLSFHPERKDSIIRTICKNSSLLVNGTVYDINNPYGVETISFPGECDSLVTVNLNFADSSVYNLDTMVCQGNSVVIEGQVFDALTPDGSVLIANGSAGGCDSVIFVQLTFFGSPIIGLSPTTCPGEINGVIVVSVGFTAAINTVVNVDGQANNISQVPVIVTGLASGDHYLIFDQNFKDKYCIPDDTIFFNIPSGPSLDTTVLQQSVCVGGNFVFNGTTYNASNPQGFAKLSGNGGCDSIVEVQLSFVDTIFSNVNQMLCFGDTIHIGNQVFDATNPNGSVPFTSAQGCDSVVQVQLSFLPEASSDIQQTLCFGDSLTVNGTIYDASHPSGMETLSTPNGCDSTINIQLTFINAVFGNYGSTICQGDTIIFQSMQFDFAHPSGEIVFPNGSASGCDSILQVNFVPGPIVTPSYQSPECDGATDGFIMLTGPWNPVFDGNLILNGVPYHFTQMPVLVENLPAGIYQLSLSPGSEVCLTDTTFELINQGQPSIELVIDNTIIPNASYQLQVNSSISNPTQIIWTPIEGLTCIDCLDPIANISLTSTYIVTLISQAGCIASDTLTIPIVRITNTFVPNGFSPDGDGNNDHFNVFGDSESIQEISLMRIFNRWGDLVFEDSHFPANSEAHGWDGSFRGKMMNTGVYVYYIKLLMIDGKTVPLKGDLTLKR
ncbi:MAG: gliding motility-associated C-terminal domain-containing protein [Saprospiraceae bacterium]